MKKILRVAGLVLSGIIVLLVIIYLTAFLQVKHRLNRIYSVKSERFDIPTDTAAVANGKHLSAIRGCNDCHGNDLGGKLLNKDFLLGTFSSANLTKGEGGLPADYTTIDWMRALRHGINRNGKSLMMMPSQEAAEFSKKDLEDIVAYINQIPPINRQLPPTQPGPMIYLLTFAGKFPLVTAERINHDMAIRQAPVNLIEKGKYLSITCQSCHRPDMKGGEPLAPGLPPVPNITPSGALSTLSANQFMTILRTGRKPDGRQINNDQMPWKMTAHYTDEEINALYAYLGSIHP